MVPDRYGMFNCRHHLFYKVGIDHLIVFMIGAHVILTSNSQYLDLHNHNILIQHTEGSVLAPLFDISPNKLRQCCISYVIECVNKYTSGSYANNLVDVYDPSLAVIIQLNGFCLVHDQD